MTVKEIKEGRLGRRCRVRPQHDNFLIRKDLDQEFSPTPPVTTFAYFSLFLPQNVTVLSLYIPHSANPIKREVERGREGERRENRKEMGREDERGRERGRGERERRENGKEMGREGKEGGREGRHGGGKEKNRGSENVSN